MFFIQPYSYKSNFKFPSTSSASWNNSSMICFTDLISWLKQAEWEFWQQPG